jgi:hypothetical protein
MRNDPIWYGFLEAGDKSTAVVLDERLNTGNPKTLYLFNLARSAILEYSREIVQPKLRELTARETKLLEELQSAFSEARRGFQPRVAQTLDIPERAVSRPARSAPLESEADLEALADVDPDDTDDADWDEDEDEA